MSTGAASSAPTVTTLSASTITDFNANRTTPIFSKQQQQLPNDKSTVESQLNQTAPTLPTSSRNFDPVLSPLHSNTATTQNSRFIGTDSILSPLGSATTSSSVSVKPTVEPPTVHTPLSHTANISAVSAQSVTATIILPSSTSSTSIASSSVEQPKSPRPARKEPDISNVENKGPKWATKREATDSMVSSLVTLFVQMQLFLINLLLRMRMNCGLQLLLPPQPKNFRLNSFKTC